VKPDDKKPIEDVAREFSEAHDALFAMVGTLEAVGLLPPRRRRGRGKSQKNLELIDAARQILSEIHPATVRAVCYRLFIDYKLIPSMDTKHTGRVSSQLTDARDMGLIPWEWIVDETRAPERINAWDNLPDYLETVKRAYRRDRWSTQPEWIEVWSEKGTVRGTLAPVLNDFGVTFRVMHGYGSTTVVHDVAEETRDAGRDLTVFYVGDWDPSGLHMSEIDLPRRLAKYGGTVTIERLALTRADIDREHLPSFPAKTLDKRYGWFRANYGTLAWELDSLSPVILREHLEHAILDRLDVDAWNQHDAAEKAEFESITNVVTTMKRLNGVFPDQSGNTQNLVPGRLL
jgi:hypothetical protein